MQRLIYKVTLPDKEPFTVACDHRDVRKFLAETRPGQELAWARDQVIMQATFMAWHAARREGKYAHSFDEFNELAISVEDITPDKEEEADPRPTKKGKSAS